MLNLLCRCPLTQPSTEITYMFEKDFMVLIMLDWYLIWIYHTCSFYSKYSSEMVKLYLHHRYIHLYSNYTLLWHLRQWICNTLHILNSLQNLQGECKVCSFQKRLEHLWNYFLCKIKLKNKSENKCQLTVLSFLC